MLLLRLKTRCYRSAITTDNCDFQTKLKYYIWPHLCIHVFVLAIIFVFIRFDYSYFHQNRCCAACSKGSFCHSSFSSFLSPVFFSPPLWLFSCCIIPTSPTILPCLYLLLILLLLTDRICQSYRSYVVLMRLLNSNSPKSPNSSNNPTQFYVLIIQNAVSYSKPNEPDFSERNSPKSLNPARFARWQYYGLPCNACVHYKLQHYFIDVGLSYYVVSGDRVLFRGCHRRVAPGHGLRPYGFLIHSHFLFCFFLLARHSVLFISPSFLPEGAGGSLLRRLFGRLLCASLSWKYCKATLSFTTYLNDSLFWIFIYREVLINAVSFDASSAMWLYIQCQSTFRWLLSISDVLFQLSYQIVLCVMTAFVYVSYQ